MTRGELACAGYSLVEAVLAVTLTALLLALVAGTAAGARRGVERLARSAERIEAARLARTLGERLSVEGAELVPVPGRDEVRGRLPIGWATPCDSVFLWAGIRAPDPARDSAVVVDSESRVRTVAVTATSIRPCGAGEGRTFSTEPAVPGATLLRVFEAGVIRIDDAVRYARWGTPRQPISAASLSPARSGVEVVDGNLRMRVGGQEGRGLNRSWLAR